MPARNVEPFTRRADRARPSLLNPPARVRVRLLAPVGHAVVLRGRGVVGVYEDPLDAVALAGALRRARTADAQEEILASAGGAP